VTTPEILREARALIDTPEKWAKGYYAFGPDGSTRDIEDPEACRFCVRGALFRIESRFGYMVEAEASKAIYKAVPDAVRIPADEIGNNAVVVFNDHPETTHAEILALFDRAIAAAEAQS
jgi:hypothetical protein